MAGVRKMLGKVDSAECVALMGLIETQSKKTLEAWAIAYCQKNYLGIYEECCPDDRSMGKTILACMEYLEGNKRLGEMKVVLRETAQVARGKTNHPIAQAAGRAISVGCSTIQTPTNALGFLFYGAAAVAYSRVGLGQTEDVYEELAAAEFKRALESLQSVSVAEEQNPVKIKWNC